MTDVAEAIFLVTTGTADGCDHGSALGAEGRLDIKLSTRGDSASGTRREPPSAARGVVRFEDAVGLAAVSLKRVASDDTAMDATFELCIVDGAHSLQARFNVRIPRLPPDLAGARAEMAHRSCRYCKATRSTTDAAIDMV
jgi:hypothetical protein